MSLSNAVVYKDTGLSPVSVMSSLLADDLEVVACC